MKKKQLALAIMQRQLADALGVDVMTARRLEHQAREVLPHLEPALMTDATRQDG